VAATPDLRTRSLTTVPVRQKTQYCQRFSNPGQYRFSDSGVPHRKWVLTERSKGRTCKAGAQPWPKQRSQNLPYRSERTRGRALCRADGPGREVESRVVKATTPSTPIPNPASQPFTEASEKHKLTATRKTARPQNSDPKTTAGPKLAAGKSKKETAASAKPKPLNPLLPPWWSQIKVPHPLSRKFLISSITFPYLHVWS